MLNENAGTRSREQNECQAHEEVEDVGLSRRRTSWKNGANTSDRTAMSLMMLSEGAR
jgi:hypothetical protein